jgi:3-oxoacyl-[acyl-carrier-protein] synthase II
METVEPVWITGVGAATPLGSDLAEIEANLLAGRSGVSLVTRFPTEDYPSRIAAQLNHPLRPRDCDTTSFSAKQPLDQLAHCCESLGVLSRGSRRTCARYRGGVDAALGGRQ